MPANTTTQECDIGCQHKGERKTEWEKLWGMFVCVCVTVLWVCGWRIAGASCGSLQPWRVHGAVLCAWCRYVVCGGARHARDARANLPFSLSESIGFVFGCVRYVHMYMAVVYGGSVSVYRGTWSVYCTRLCRSACLSGCCVYVFRSCTVVQKMLCSFIALVWRPGICVRMFISCTTCTRRQHLQQHTGVDSDGGVETTAAALADIYRASRIAMRLYMCVRQCQCYGFPSIVFIACWQTSQTQNASGMRHHVGATHYIDSIAVAMVAFCAL